jgi:photosystem II stability/assembly factor-like uncharacterized protein
MSLPFDPKSGMIVISQENVIAVVGKGVVVISENGGKTWRNISAGTGIFSRYSVDDSASSLNKTSELEVFKTDELCDAEDVIMVGKRLFVNSMCEHEMQIWSIPIIPHASTWYISSFPLTSSGSFQISNRLRFTGDRIVVSAYLHMRGGLMATADSGENWFVHWVGTDESRIVDFGFLNADYGYLLNSNGVLSITHTSGREWTRRTQLPQELAGNATSIAFADERVGYIVGADGLVYKTGDGGLTWRSQNSGTKMFLNKVVAPTPRNAFILVDSRAVLFTRDGGMSWRKIELSREDDLLRGIDGISANASSACFVSGSQIYFLN